MPPELTDAILEIGNELFDLLPEANDVAEDYEPDATVNQFYEDTINMFKTMLWDHLQSVVYDWENQRPEYQED